MKLQGLDIDVVRKGSGQPLLLLHGGGGPIAQMPFADRLAEKFEIFAPTHPGFNGSKIPKHFTRV
ncbi:MAG: alpha/beta hydrolase, partial [Pseudomonadota bacterium]|nr:alpha/beta hydrolase [Pseudomonadota bacterium]